MSRNSKNAACLLIEELLWSPCAARTLDLHSAEGNIPMREREIEREREREREREKMRKLQKEEGGDDVLLVKALRCGRVHAWQ